MRRFLPAAFVLSLLFNVAVIAGFLLGARPPHGAGPHEPPRMDLKRAMRALDLNESQREAFKKLQDESRAAMIGFDEEANFLEQVLNDELAKESPSGERIRETLDRQAELVRERRRTQADLFERFQRELTPEQRATLRRELDGGRPNRDGPPIKRFDRDGDGRLNDDEARAAREAFDAQREARGRERREPGEAGRRPEGREGREGPPLLPFFDRDGDGRLDDKERAERDEFVRTHQPVRPRGRPDAP